MVFLLANRADVNNQMSHTSILWYVVNEVCDIDARNKVIQCLMTSEIALNALNDDCSEDNSDDILQALKAKPKFVLAVCPQNTKVKEKQVAMTKAFESYKVEASATFCNELSNLFNEQYLVPTLLAFCGDGSGLPVSALEVTPEAMSIVGETEI